MLALRGDCERCRTPLPPDSPDARICSFECTFCAACASALGDACPNCEGDLTPRPTRTGDALTRNPPTHDRPSRTAAFRRKPERRATERAELDAFLDSQLVGVLATVDGDEPWVVPLLYGRDGDTILLHGSTGAGALRHIADGAPVAFCVSIMDGLVVAESTFDSSANYRSAVIRGHLRTVHGRGQRDVLDLLSERLLPGRTSEVGGSTRKQVAATVALVLDITDDNWLMKTRTGGPGAPEGPVGVWCGVVPLVTTAGVPQAAPWSVGPVPSSVERFVAARPAP
mgnify:FL=1